MNNDKLDLQSTDITAMNIERIVSLFPNCVTETADGKRIDFDLLKQELSTEIVEGNKERYRLEWPGKREAIVTANIPTNNTLRPVREDSVDFDTTENIYIEGDNLEVLKLLQESYLNKIKMIYIDPPYNTGKDFVYKDNFAKSSEEELLESGQKDEYGQRLQANPETSGRYHSDWLSMMYPRLKLARNLLTDDGVIFISIDDNEVHNLRKICDEIFGEGNFVAQICHKARASVSNDKIISPNHNIILFYAKEERIIFSKRKQIGLKPILDGFDKEDENGKYKLVPVDGPGGAKKGNPYYEFEGILGYWRFSKERMTEMYKQGLIVVTGNNLQQKYYLKDAEKSRRTATTWWDEKLYTSSATSKLKTLLESGAFDTPKPVELVYKMLEMIAFDKNDIILDFFSGSATTAHAVMQLNAEDQGNRKYIMVQLPEVTNEKSEAYKAGYKNICEIGKERIRRAAASITNEEITNYESKKAQLEKLINAKLRITKSITNDQLGITKEELSFPEGVLIDEKAEEMLQEIRNLQFVIHNSDKGFRVYRLDSSNMQDVYYKPQDYNQNTLDLFADNVKEDRSAEDLVAQIMLDWGLALSLPIERKTIADKEVYAVADNSLYCCFDKDIDEAFAKEVAKDQPLRIVFRDNGFKDDTAKENVKQLLKQLAPNTEMKVV